MPKISASAEDIDAFKNIFIEFAEELNTAITNAVSSVTCQFVEKVDNLFDKDEEVRY